MVLYKSTIYILFLLGSFSFYGCTVPVEFYLRNFTENQITLKLSKRKDFEFQGLKFQNTIVEMDFGIHKTFSSTLKPFLEKEDSLYFNIAPKTTVYMEMGPNFSNLFFTNFTIIKNKKEEISLKLEDFEVKKKIRTQYYMWYDIRKL